MENIILPRSVLNTSAVVIQLMRNFYRKHLVRIISVPQAKGYLNFKSSENTL
jgi:hypothetical protein